MKPVFFTFRHSMYVRIIVPIMDQQLSLVKLERVLGVTQFMHPTIDYTQFTQHDDKTSPRQK